MRRNVSLPTLAQLRQHAPDIIEHLLTAGAVLYALMFAWRQTSDLGDRRVLEWDARAFTLPAWRYHGTGLFPDDLLVDFVAAITPPGPKLVYWLGTIFTDPLLLSKLLPFIGLAVVVGYGYQLGRALGGRALGAGAIVMLCHCSLLWDRMVGGNPRAFGFPLLVVFLRYAACHRERGALVALFLQAACYPSAFVVCAPAYGLTLLSGTARKRRILRFSAVALLALACIPSAWGHVDPRVGTPPTYAQAATLRQMQPGGAQPFYPLPTLLGVILRSAGETLGPYGQPLWPAAIQWNSRLSDAIAWLVFGLLIAAAMRGRIVLAPIFSALWMSSLLGLYLAQLLAYRLFLPERLLTYTWPVLFPLAALEAVRQILAPRLGRWAAIVATLLLGGLLLVCYGDGLPQRLGVHDWRSQDTPLVRHLATLPADIRIAAQPRPAAFIQAFARRQTFISSTTNMLPHGYQYGLAMEGRFEAFFRAYYSDDLSTLVRFATSHRIDYIVVDARDFGRDALARSRYAEPWNRLTAELLSRHLPETLVLADPPPSSIVFRDGPVLLVDLHRLAEHTSAPHVEPPR